MALYSYCIGPVSMCIRGQYGVTKSTHKCGYTNENNNQILRPLAFKSLSIFVI